MVRVCEPTYNKRALEDAGISVHDWLFPDGDSPPESVITDWLKLVELRQAKHDQDDSYRSPSIGCHCVAGLGRYAVFVILERQCWSPSP